MAMLNVKEVKVEYGTFGDWMDEEKPKDAVSDEFYNTLLDKVDAASKKAQNSTQKTEPPVSSDKEVSSTLKKTIKDVFEGDHGVDFADSYAILDEKDKAEFESIVLSFINVLENEIADKGNVGAMQSLLDRLFPTTVQGIDPFEEVREAILNFKKDGTANAEDIMGKIIPMLLEASANAEKTTSYEYGTLSVNGEEMSLEDMLEAMQEIAAMITEINASLNPEQNPELNPEENPEGEISGVTGGTETPEVNEGTETPAEPVVPEVNEEPETPVVPETSETTEETTEEHLESPAEMVELLSRNGFATTSTSFTRNTTELEEIAVSSISQQNIQNFGNIANFDEATMMSVQRQVITATQEIMGRLTVNSSDEVNLVLNPENLGRISVRLTNQGGDIIIRIAAESEETQAILRERLPSLMQSLTEINNSVREITVEEISQSAEMQANLMFGNGSNAQAQSEQGNNYSNEAVEEISETEETDSMKGVSRLWQKA